MDSKTAEDYLARINKRFNDLYIEYSSAKILEQPEPEEEQPMIQIKQGPYYSYYSEPHQKYIDLSEEMEKKD